MRPASYTSMDVALEILAGYGPDLSNGMTNHAPMASEALCALGHPEAVLPWLDGYRKLLVPRAARRERIVADQWKQALAKPDRFADWSAFISDELRESSWRVVLDRWVERLAPGICASATHGVIRTGHAARSLADCESPVRLRELAEGLGYWAAEYQELPTNIAGASGTTPREAIQCVPLVPPELRRFSGTITSSLDALKDFPDFALVIGFLDTRGDSQKLISELTEVFARVYLANAHDFLTTIVFIHGVTSLSALGNILPHVSEATVRHALPYAWQTSCALYSAFGTKPLHGEEIQPVSETAESLTERAVAHGDEHAIKFTEVCIRQNEQRSSPAYFAAARHAIESLPPC